MRLLKPILVVGLLGALLAACAGPTQTVAPGPTVEPTTPPTETPTVAPTAAPTPTASPPAPPTAAPLPTSQLNVLLTTDSPYYPPSKVELHLTVTNHGTEPVYLPICGPWGLVKADTLEMAWAIQCEIDYLGHKIEPGESFSGVLAEYLSEGSYRVVTEVYGDCTLGQPKTISDQETYYGEFSDCAIRETVYSEPFGVE